MCMPRNLIHIGTTYCMLPYYVDSKPHQEFFHREIVNKTGNFKDRVILPEFRVVISDIKAFPYIYLTFQFHKFEWMIMHRENVLVT